MNDVAHLRFIDSLFVGVSVVDNINVPSVVKWTDRTVQRLFPKPDLQVSFTYFVTPIHSY